jgi:hypothetical protein
VSHLQRWCNAMERSALLKLVLSNVALDVLTKRLDLKFSKLVFDAVTDSWDADVGNDADDMDGFAKRVFEKVLAQVDDDALCRGPEITLGDSDISRVSDHAGVWDFNLDKGAFPSPDGGLPDEQFWLDIEKAGLSSGQIRTGSMVRGARNFAWITLESTLDDIRSEYDDLRPATQVRNYLGLDHFEAGFMLLELHYPKKMLDGYRVAAPTFIEGGTKAVYQSVSVKGDDDHWGRTARLDKMGDGKPEAVHMAIPFTAEVKIRLLGVVQEAPPPLDPDEYLKTREHQWHSGDDERIVETIEKEP